MRKYLRNGSYEEKKFLWKYILNHGWGFCSVSIGGYLAVVVLLFFELQGTRSVSGLLGLIYVSVADTSKPSYLLPFKKIKCKKIFEFNLKLLVIDLEQKSALPHNFKRKKKGICQHLQIQRF